MVADDVNGGALRLRGTGLALFLAMSFALCACGLREAPSAESAFQAAYANDAGTLERLLKHGIDPSSKNASGESLLYVATGPKGRTEVTRILLKAGANPNLGQGSYTPLMNATSWVQLDTVELLLQAGADPDLKNSAGETALQTTGRASGRESVVKDRFRLAQKKR